MRWLGPSPLRPDGTREATHRHWFRLPRALDDDPHLHTALLGYATDWTGIGGRPLHLEGDTTGMISLDHAAWFHRPARADEWLLQDVQSLVNAGGRGTLRGVIRDHQRSDRRVDGPGDAPRARHGSTLRTLATAKWRRRPRRPGTEPLQVTETVGCSSCGSKHLEWFTLSGDADTRRARLPRYEERPKETHHIIDTGIAASSSGSFGSRFQPRGHNRRGHSFFCTSSSALFFFPLRSSWRTSSK